jgi:hypothetical protein
MGEPVEEFGVGGKGALHAEIVLGLDDALSEMAHPNAVDGDARDEGVVGPHEPPGEVEAVELDQPMAGSDEAARRSMPLPMAPICLQCLNVSFTKWTRLEERQSVSSWN